MLKPQGDLQDILKYIDKILEVINDIEKKPLDSNEVKLISKKADKLKKDFIKKYPNYLDMIK